MGKTPEEIEIEIKQARLDLAEKVDALADEVKQTADVVKKETDNVKDKVMEIKAAAVKVAAVGFVAVVGILIIKRSLRARR